ARRDGRGRRVRGLRRPRGARRSEGPHGRDARGTPARHVGPLAPVRRRGGHAGERRVTTPRLTRAAGLGAALLLVACGGYGTALPPDGSPGPGAAGANGGADAAAGAVATLPDSTATPSFQPRPEFAGPCERANGAVDVNLGNSPEAFVRAATCQVTGAEPAADAVTKFAGLLRTDDHTRRIDVMRQICLDAKRMCPLAYSDPWQADIPLAPVCTRKTKRDLGAVLMFFSNCPGGVNCGMDWANTHAHGMN